ncbi:MAG: class I SAM-dependent methyltransferase, partial [Pontiella sp.]|nr:class I SAM-dependent methyltransferase [Pontiella sp.]
MSERNFEQMYREGDTPWDHGTHDFNLEEIIAQFGIRPCKILDLGCGTGSNSIWLAQQGFDVVGIDLSDTAIRQAQKKTGKAGMNCSFQSADFLEDDIKGAPFALVFDRGCLHSIPGSDDRARFAGRVAAMLDREGYWLSLIGNADEPPREVGPPQM